MTAQQSAAAIAVVSGHADPIRSGPVRVRVGERRPDYSGSDPDSLDSLLEQGGRCAERLETQAAGYR